MCLISLANKSLLAHKFICHFNLIIIFVGIREGGNAGSIQNTERGGDGFGKQHADVGAGEEADERQPPGGRGEAHQPQRHRGEQGLPRGRAGGAGGSGALQPPP